jgi:hypothetical protein
MSLPSFLCYFFLTLSLRWGLLPIPFIEAVSLSSSGSSVSLDGIPYFVSPYSLGKLSLEEVDVSGSVSVGGMYPITLVSNATAVSDFTALIESFVAEDDVFQTGFLQSMFAKSSLEVLNLCRPFLDIVARQKAALVLIDR